MSDETIGAFVINGVRYPCPRPDVMKFGEAHFVQQACGIPALKAWHAVAQGDMDAMAAFIVVAMRRSGKKVAGVEDLYDMELGHVDFDPAEDEDEDDTIPPPAGGSSDAGTASSDGSPGTTPGTPGSPVSATSSV